jgi:hypothetical protein
MYEMHMESFLERPGTEINPDAHLFSLVVYLFCSEQKRSGASAGCDTRPALPIPAEQKRCTIPQDNINAITNFLLPSQSLPFLNLRELLILFFLYIVLQQSPSHLLLIPLQHVSMHVKYTTVTPN